MENAHPTTRFLLRYGDWIRGAVIGLILCLMLQTGFLSFGESQIGADIKILSLCLFIMGVFAPSVGQFAFAPFWQKITPIKNRVTYFEDEIVFIGSALIGLSAALFFWTLIPILDAIMISARATLAGLPAFFLIWFVKSSLTPLHAEDTAEQVAAAQTFRDETPHFWRNALAYVVSATIAALILTQALMLIIYINGGDLAFGVELQTFGGLTVMNIICAPIFIWIGRMLKPKDADPMGVHLTLGAVSLLTLIVLLNAPVIFKGSYDMQAIIAAWPFGVAYALMVFSYIGGGFVFSKLYKPRPPGLAFG